MFTDGKNRFYEKLMQEPPNGKYKPGRAGVRKFRYKYEDVSCDFCLHAKKCKEQQCFFILDNLDDLLRDTAFCHAVENADTCDTRHKQTLLYLFRERVGRID